MFFRKNKTDKQINVGFVFSKAGLMRYISHLDLIRLLMRAARRAELPLYFTKGFNPRPKLIIKRALKLGMESDNEQAQFILTHNIKPKVFENRLNRQLPQGLKIKDVSILSAAGGFH
jgi:radical SAM-linked protein